MAYYVPPAIQIIVCFFGFPKTIILHILLDTNDVFGAQKEKNKEKGNRNKIVYFIQIYYFLKKKEKIYCF